MFAPVQVRGRPVVVVVEDEGLTRAVACMALGDAGFDVVEAAHADAAMAHLREHATAVDALFADIHCPGVMDGLDLAQYARQHWPWIAVLVASGLTRPTTAALPEGSRFLPKPYELDHVIRQLNEMMSEQHSRTAN